MAFEWVVMIRLDSGQAGCCQRNKKQHQHALKVKACVVEFTSMKLQQLMIRAINKRYEGNAMDRRED